MASSVLSDSALRTLQAPNVNRLVVALSGGLDSITLLHAVAHQIQGPEILALHINHGLHQDAMAWQSHCEAVCLQWGVRLLCERVEVQTQRSIETEARLARYRVFEDTLGTGDLLLLAHHEDDQQETGFFQLMRGHAGSGLMGMPMLRSLGAGQIFRPLLEVNQSVLQAYARQHALPFVEDPSNQDLSHDRNFIRHQVFPMLNTRFEGWSQRFLRQLSEDGETRRLLVELGQDDLRSIATESGWDITLLGALGERRASNALKTLLMLSANGVPTRGQIDACSRMLTQGSTQAPGLFSALGYEFHRHQGQFNVVSELPGPWIEGPALVNDAFHWTVLGLSFKRQTCMGGLKAGLPALKWTLDKQGKSIELDRPVSVSDLLSQAGIPVWARFRLPVLEINHQVVAIPAVPRWGFKQRVSVAYAQSSADSGEYFEVRMDDDLRVKGIVLSP